MMFYILQNTASEPQGNGIISKIFFKVNTTVIPKDWTICSQSSPQSL